MIKMLNQLLLSNGMLNAVDKAADTRDVFVHSIPSKNQVHNCDRLRFGNFHSIALFCVYLSKGMKSFAEIRAI